MQRPPLEHSTVGGREGSAAAAVELQAPHTPRGSGHSFFLSVLVATF